MTKARDLATSGPDLGLVHIDTTTFSGVASQSINDVFTSTYTNYRIIIDDLTGATGNQDIDFRLRASGTDLSANQYNSAYFQVNSTSLVGARFLNQNLQEIGGVGYLTDKGLVIIEIQNPQTAKITTGISQNLYVSTGTGDLQRTYYFRVANSNQYDGFTLFASNYTISGTVSVYGYKK